MKHLLTVLLALSLAGCIAESNSGAADSCCEKKKCDFASDGWVSLFNGKDLDGWKRHEHLPGHGMAGKWFVQDGAIVGVQDPPGKGGFLTTLKEFDDFEFRCQVRIDWPFDSGVFLRTGPKGKSHQVTLDYRDGGQIGGIYLPWTQGFVRECPEGIGYWKKDAWNDLRIFCAGEPALIQVWLNGQLITNFQHTEKTTRNVPRKGGISLQVHPGGQGFEKNAVRFKDIRIRPLAKLETGFRPLFNGIDLTGWVGDTDGYRAENGVLICRGRNLYTQEQFGDFHLKFEFQLTPGTNNGLGIRTPLEGDAAYVGMELQILDDTASQYAGLQPWQYHGSIYGVVPAKRGFLKPLGQWNRQEVIAKGRQIKVILNGKAIVEADITEAIDKGTLDGKDHPGLKCQTGHIGFLGHGSVVRFRDIQIKELGQ